MTKEVEQLETRGGSRHTDIGEIKRLQKTSEDKRGKMGSKIERMTGDRARECEGDEMERVSE